MKVKQLGFSILTSALVLSFISVVYTVNLAQSQLIDNQVLGNYYRNSEAFVNAESGVNFVLSKLNTITIADELLKNLPFIYPTTMNDTTLYQVTVTKIESNKLHVTSTGKSQDGSASRDVSLDVYYSTAFNIPISPLSSNGKLNIGPTGTINDGCEGVAKMNCRSPGNIADQLIISQPSAEQEETAFCTGTALRSDSIDKNAIYGAVEDEEGRSRVMEVSGNQWGKAASSSGSVFDQVTSLDDMDNATSLFESTFGITLAGGKEELASSGVVARIDMTQSSAVSCSDLLQNVDDEISVIYIKGDCNIDQNDPSHNTVFENKRFTIGTADNPKMVFIEGGTFIMQSNTGASVIGMLYFIPGVNEVLDENGDVIYEDNVKKTTLDQSVSMAGVRVNGALLSEYNCSVDGNGEMDNNDTKQHFSSRYDKTILNRLYSQLGMAASASHYQLVAGSWRDF